jgi:5-methylcytosine-specific restriction protein A
LPVALDEAIPGLLYRYQVKGSIGQGGWTHTPWVAVLDPAVTDTVQEGFYVVYLLSYDGERLYLSLNQGCTALYREVREGKAAAELRRRAELMRSRIPKGEPRFKRTNLRLGSDIWRGKLYEAGEIASVEYHALALPDERQLVEDLQEALRLYKAIDNAGGWQPEDTIVREAEEDGRSRDLESAKRYRQHRSIERNPKHSREVKRVQGTRCKACRWEMGELYGAKAAGVAHAHHLIPLSSLADGEIARFDPQDDFAVLCPNCHAVIHKLDDVSDLEGLRAMISSAGKMDVSAKRTK